MVSHPHRPSDHGDPIARTATEAHIAYKKKWDEVLKDGACPKYLRSVVRIPFGDFRDKARSASPAFVSEFIGSIYAGDLWVVERTLSAEQVAAIKHTTLSFRSDRPESNPKVVEGCDHFHVAFDGSSAPPGGYVAADHSSYFFRWNGDAFGLFGMVDDVWGLGKILSGRAPDQYRVNTPKDLFVDRIQIIQYPAGIGQITTHIDPFITMKLNLGIFMTTYGVEYQHGGFFISSGAEQPTLLDPQIGAGDMVLWFPNLVHGVETVDPDEAVDWNSPGGRWYLHLNTIESGLVKDRHVARREL